MASLQDEINEALEQYLGQYLSPEARQKITERYGTEVEAQVAALYDEALNCPVDWRIATMDDGLAILDAMLDKYTWLSQGARKSRSFFYYGMEVMDDDVSGCVSIASRST